MCTVSTLILSAGNKMIVSVQIQLIRLFSELTNAMIIIQKIWLR